MVGEGQHSTGVLLQVTDETLRHLADNCPNIRILVRSMNVVHQMQFSLSLFRLSLDASRLPTTGFGTSVPALLPRRIFVLWSWIIAHPSLIDRLIISLRAKISNVWISSIANKSARMLLKESKYPLCSLSLCNCSSALS